MLAAVEPGTIRAMAVCTVFFLAILGAIIYALLEHQRKMAEILRKDRDQTNGLDEKVSSLQSEIQELKSLLTASANSHTSVTEDLHRRF